jgi:hypothetical protein
MKVICCFGIHKYITILFKTVLFLPASQETLNTCHARKNRAKCFLKDIQASNVKLTNSLVRKRPSYTRSDVLSVVWSLSERRRAPRGKKVIHKRMVRFQTLLSNLFLTLYGHSIHCQQLKLSLLLMLTAGPPRDQFSIWNRSRSLSVCSVLRCPDLWKQYRVSCFVHGLRNTLFLCRASCEFVTGQSLSEYIPSELG